MQLLVTGVTFVIFFIEALMHYNIGKNGGMTAFHLPNRNELLPIVLVVLLFSTVNGYIIGTLHDRYG